MDNLLEYLIAPVGQVVLIMAIAQLIKNLGFNKRYIPLVDVVLGLISGIVVYGIEAGYGITKGIMLGLAIGLSACGLFSGIKNTISSPTSEEDNL